MAYDAQKVLPGREPISIIELDLDVCSLTHGVGLCTSTASSDLACRNCLSTCYVTTAYARTSTTLKFASTRLDGAQEDGQAPVFPTLLSVSTAPTVLTPAKGLGVRSTVSATIADHPWTDVVTDPYIANRSYDPLTRGSLWGKLMACHTYYEGRTMRVKTGYLDSAGAYDASNFSTRTFFIDTITGPDAGGKVTVKGKDILRFADNSKAQLPVQSQAVLTSDINSAVTSVVITDPNDDVKDAYAAGQTYIRIDDEVMNMTNLTGTNPTYTLTVTRATAPSFYTDSTTAEGHSEDGTVQQCYEYNAVDIDDVVKHLVVDTAGISSAYTDLVQWQSVVDYGLQAYALSTLLSEPNGVKDLLEEITELSLLLWWDERAQTIQMDSLLNRAKNSGGYNDDETNVADSVKIARDDQSRISQVWIACGLRSPVLPMDELRNFEVVKISADLDSEGADQYDQKRVRTIRSRWLPTSLSSVASEIANRLLKYYKVTKRVVTVTLDPKDDDVWTGDLITLSTRQLQDASGDTPALSFRVLQAKEKISAGDVRYSYVMETTDDDLLRLGLIGPNTLNDYDVESEANKNKYAFIGPNAGDFSDGERTYQIF